MQREFDKLDVDLKFMDLAMQIFKLIEEEIKKDISIADINRLARTMLLVQKSVKSMKIPKTERTMMRNMNSIAKMMGALDQLKKWNYDLNIFFRWYSKKSFLLLNSGIGKDNLSEIPKFLTVTLDIHLETTNELELSILINPRS